MPLAAMLIAIRKFPRSKNGMYSRSLVPASMPKIFAVKSLTRPTGPFGQDNTTAHWRWSNATLPCL